MAKKKSAFSKFISFILIVAIIFGGVYLMILPNSFGLEYEEYMGVHTYEFNDEAIYGEEVEITDTNKLIDYKPTIVIPTEIDGKKVVSIGEAAFFNLANLKSVEFAENSNVRIVYDRAFGSCDKLERVSLPNSVLYIGEQCFYDSVSLKEVYLPLSLRVIRTNVFYGCESLQTIYYEGTINDWENVLKFEGWNYGTNDFTIICSDGVYSV